MSVSETTATTADFRILAPDDSMKFAEDKERLITCDDGVRILASRIWLNEKCDYFNCQSHFVSHRRDSGTKIGIISTSVILVLNSAKDPAQSFENISSRELLKAAEVAHYLLFKEKFIRPFVKSLAKNLDKLAIAEISAIHHFAGQHKYNSLKHHCHGQRVLYAVVQYFDHQGEDWDPAFAEVPSKQMIRFRQCAAKLSHLTIDLSAPLLEGKKLSRNQLTWILKQCPHLKKLKIRGVDIDTTVPLDCVGKSIVQLEIASAKSLYLGMGDFFPKLKTLDLRGSQVVFNRISSYPSVEELHISSLALHSSLCPLEKWHNLKRCHLPDPLSNRGLGAFISQLQDKHVSIIYARANSANSM